MDGRISPVRSVVTSLNKLMPKELTGGIANCTNTPNSTKGFASSEYESSSSGSGKRTIIDLDNYNEEEAQANKGKKIVKVKIEPTD
ncbi:hypothetical protein Tco_1271242 [Tanacetum coccineum]